MRTSNNRHPQNDSMLPQDEFDLRRLVLSVSTFIVLISGLAMCCLQLPSEDSFPIRTGATIYLICFATSNVIGFVAALQRNATLLTIFAVHLLVDGVLLFIPRLLFIRFSTSLPSSICSNAIYPADLEPGEQLRNGLSELSPAWSKGSCMVWTWSLETILVGLVVSYMGLQMVLCMRLFSYAAWLDEEERMQDLTCARPVLWTIDEKEEYV